MPTCSVSIADGSRSYRIVLDEAQRKALVGKRIGETVQGEIIGLPKYVLRITGGSDLSGTPMVKFVSGPIVKYSTLKYGTGMRTKKIRFRRRKISKYAPWANRYLPSNIKRIIRKKINEGFQRKKRLHGNVITDKITQINMIVVEKGDPALLEKLHQASERGKGKKEKHKKAMIERTKQGQEIRKKLEELKLI